MKIENLQNYYDQAAGLIMVYLPKLALSIIVLLVGIWVIKKVRKGIRTILSKRKVDPSLIPFLSSIISVILYTLLIISVASMIGIATTSFIAVLGAAGLAIGLALQGSLSNFAGGVMILLFRPFKVGDVIEAQGVTAAVTEIQIFHTILKTYDNKIIIIPNGPLHNDKIINYTESTTRVVEWIFGIGYNDDIDKAKKIIEKEIFSDERILNAETPFINLAELGDSSVNFKVRAEVKLEDYWDVFFLMNEKVKKAFDKQGITIPFPQRDVHLHNASK